METLETVLIVVHLLVVVALVAVVLLQRSEGGALGIGGGGAGGNFMSARGTANVLSRATGFLALGFFMTSIGLTILAQAGGGSSILDQIPGAGIGEDAPSMLEQMGGGTVDDHNADGDMPALTPAEPQIPSTQ